VLFAANSWSWYKFIYGNSAGLRKNLGEIAKPGTMKRLNVISQWNSSTGSLPAKESNRVSLFSRSQRVPFNPRPGPMLQQEFRQISGQSAKKASQSAPSENAEREIIKKTLGEPRSRDVIYLRQKRQIYQK